MPNVALIPAQNTRISEIDGSISGFFDMSVKLRTSVGTEPLEDGSNINDHAVANSTGLSLYGLVSDQDTSRQASDAYQKIESLWRANTPLTVITPWATFPEMLIALFTAEPSGAGMEFTIEMRKIIRVGIERPSAENTSGPASERPEPTNFGRITPVSTS